MKKTLLFMIALVLVYAGMAFSDETSKEEKWSVDDLVKMERAYSFDVSPDGKRAVWVKSRPDKDKDRHVTDLMLSSLFEESEIQLTRSSDSDNNPKWRPDGKMIAFLSSRKEKESDSGGQVWLINPAGGEPWQLTSHSESISDFEWLDNERLVLLTRETKNYREMKLKEKKDTTIIYEGWEDFVPRRLFIYSIEGKKMTRATDNDLPINSFAVSHDGKHAIVSMTLTPNQPDPKNKPKYALFDLETGESKELFPDPLFYPGNFSWAHDDSGFFFTFLNTSDYVNVGAGPQKLYWFDIGTMQWEEVPLQHDWDLGRGYDVIGDGVLASLAAGTRYQYAIYRKTDGGWSKTPLKANDIEHIAGLQVARDGKTVIATYSWADKGTKLYSATLHKDELKDLNEFTKFNKHLKNRKFTSYEVMRWTGSLDETVEGILYYPMDYEEGKKYPLVISIHGGPQGYDTIFFSDRWSTYPHLMSQRGAFVLKPNYHGSGNYGREWAESIRENYYDLEVPEIIKAANILIDKGLVDENKLGVMGWSNGAILAIEIALRDSRFKVCSFGAGDVNWTSDYGNCHFGPTFDNYYLGGAPWEIPDVYVKKSPLFRLDTLETPVIIFHGTEDTNVPTEQGFEAFRALQVVGKAPVRFLVFPGEPHGLNKLTHQKRKLQEELIWFDKYLFETWEKPNPALKKDSRLMHALKMEEENIATEGGYYGLVHDSVLIPETVKVEDLEIGRFEVTRQQYKAFDPEYSFTPDSGNHPATGISFERAKQYCEWLSEQTDKTYRLPTVEEMEALIKKAKGSANNLDYWAGYAVNPEDEKLLRQELTKLSPDALLLAAGSMGPAINTSIFDIKGNAAEWCTTADGSARACGGCAALAEDKAGKGKTPPAGFIGFRVIRQ